MSKKANDEVDQAPMDRAHKVRAGLIMGQPFFGTAALHLELKQDPSCQTAWTDGKTLGFNPEYMMNTPMEELEGVMAHQVMRCVLGHHLRRGGRDRGVWNDAGAHVVNHELHRAHFHLPTGALMDPEFDALHAEAVYSALYQRLEEGDEQPGPTAGGQDQGGGSGAGEGAPGDHPSAAAGTTGEVRDCPGDDGGVADTAEVAEQEAEWQSIVAQAAQVARGQGRLAGGIEHAIESFLNPKVDWREALHRFLKSRAKDDYSWSKPNRRYQALGLHLPSLDSQRVGPIVVAIDTSGSITQSLLDQFISELEEIRTMVKPERVVVMMCDTQVRLTLVFEPDDPLENLRAAGEGGTAFDDPFRQVEKLGIEPEALVYLTDLDSSVFPQEPSYPTLWVSTYLEQAPFGEVILM